ncbi:MAG: preprotein translocase subunit SecG [Deltaproteobacteria bacterium]|nr:preprotein translocase subunit SecG [Deltaproteobacteria bacterium]
MAHFLVAFEPVILVLHFIVAIFLISVILLQSGKGSDIGAAFGAGSSQTLFGARGAATLLSKITTAAAIVFILTSLSLATVSKYAAVGSSGSSIAEELQKEEASDVIEANEVPEAAPTE